MELVQSSPEENQSTDYHSNVDTSRPFRSVKEAVAVFGERFLVSGEICYPKRFSFPKQEMVRMHSSPSPMRPERVRRKSEENDDAVEVADTLKKLEAELRETKLELKMLKERESETEVALASLNAELHKNMSKIAQAEATAAAMAASKTMSMSSITVLGSGEADWSIKKKDAKDRIRTTMSSSSLAEILNISDRAKKQTEKEKKIVALMNKRKPIIPLVGELFWRKKESSPSTLNNPLFTSAHIYLN